VEKNVMTCDETEALSALAILQGGRSINPKRRPRHKAGWAVKEQNPADWLLCAAVECQSANASNDN